MISLIILIALLGLIVYLVTTYIPMPEPFKKIIYIVSIVVLGLYLLRVFGIWDGGDVGVPRLQNDHVNIRL